MENKEIQEIVNLFKSGKFDIAEKKVLKLLKKFPNNFNLYSILGSIFVGQKKLDKAIINYKKSLKNNPNYAIGYNNLAVALAGLHKYEEAVENYNHAIKIKPDYAEAYNNLGLALNKLGNLEKSIESYQRAIKINPQYLDSLKNLGKIFRKIGKIDEARKYFDKVIEIEPNNIEYKINSKMLMEPIVRSAEDIKFNRDEYEKSLEILGKYKYLTEYPGLTIKIGSFFLSYHNKNNLNLIKKTSELYRKLLPNINYVSKNLKNSKKRKIKIGFISEYLTGHTVGKLFGGLIKNINKDKFEVVLFHTAQTKKSDLKTKIDNSVDKVIILKLKIMDQQKQIEYENLDIIFYPDIGMSSTTYFLSFSRLAPVQIASYGHPETTGINTIDYFLSSTLFEPNNNKKYSEKLICLDQFPSYYEPPQNIEVVKNRKDLNLPENARIYGCLQTLFKLHPDFDSILSKILERDPEGYIVLIGGEGKIKYWIEKLKQRWRKKFPNLINKVIFTKQLSFIEFISLCDSANVLLDPIYFGGGNTILEALLVGTPTVTMPDLFLRTNVAKAAYMQTKILNPPVVNTSEEYIDLAIELAKNKEKNSLLRKQLKYGANKYLYKNSNVLSKFEEFFKKAHMAALEGKKLKDGQIF